MVQGALESSLATAVGPASVSILADSIFGYKFGDAARPSVHVFSYVWAVGIASEFHWVGLRENLQETIDFPMKYKIFLFFLP